MFDKTLIDFDYMKTNSILRDEVEQFLDINSVPKDTLNIINQQINDQTSITECIISEKEESTYLL